MEPQRTRRNTLCPQERRSKAIDILRWKIDSLLVVRPGGSRREDEATLGGIEGLITTRAQRRGNDNSLNFLKMHNFSGFSVVIF
jgi:hypothetical protein